MSAPAPTKLEPQFVVNSNVLLGIFSCFDITRAGRENGYDAEHPKVVERRRRARGSLLFALQCHRKNLVTLSLHREPIRIFKRYVPPDADEGLHTRFFLYFVRDYLLTGWKAMVDRDADLGMTGNRNDDLLLDWAIQRGIPLVTRAGPKKRLQKRARAANHTVFSPDDYIRGRVDENAAVLDFFTRFDAHKLCFAAEFSARSCENPTRFSRHVENIGQRLVEFRYALSWMLRPTT